MGAIFWVNRLLCLWISDPEKASCWIQKSPLGCWVGFEQPHGRGVGIGMTFKVSSKLSVMVQSAPEPPEGGLHPEQSRAQDGSRRELGVQSSQQTWQMCNSQRWEQEQKGRGRLGALFLLLQELTAGFWGQGSSGAPRALGRRLVPQARS